MLNANFDVFFSGYENISLHDFDYKINYSVTILKSNSKIHQSIILKVLIISFNNKITIHAEVP